MIRTTDFIPMPTSELDWLIGHEASLHAFPWTRGNFLDSLAAGHDIILMRQDGRAVAYAVVLTVLDEIHLLNFGVCRESQGNGMGTTFIRHLAEQGRAGGATQFFLEVRCSNEAAIKLYHKTGFEKIGTRKRYYPGLDGTREDAIVMRLAL